MSKHSLVGHSPGNSRSMDNLLHRKSHAIEFRITKWRPVMYNNYEQQSPIETEANGMDKIQYKNKPNTDTTDENNNQHPPKHKMDGQRPSTC